MSYSFLQSIPLSVTLSYRASTARRVLGELADFSSWMGMPSILQDGTTPAGQVARLLVFRQFQGLLEGVLEVGLYDFVLDPSTQKIRPQEFAERRRVLGEPAGAPQFARQRAERIVF
jgi:hypothetical protein